MSTKLLVRKKPVIEKDPVDELNDSLLVSANRLLGHKAPSQPRGYDEGVAVHRQGQVLAIVKS